MYAVVEINGKQYKVREGDIVRVDKIKKDGELEFSAIVFGEKIERGKVLAKKIKDGKGKKIIVFKFKTKKRYRRKYGVRHHYSLIKIEKIVCQQ